MSKYILVVEVITNKFHINSATTTALNKMSNVTYVVISVGGAKSSARSAIKQLPRLAVRQLLANYTRPCTTGTKWWES